MPALRRVAGTILAVAMTACADPPSGVTPPEPAFARAPSENASVAGGLQSGAFVVKKFDSGDPGFRVEAQQSVAAVLNLGETVEATTAGCAPGSYGADAGTMAALLSKLANHTAALYLLVAAVNGNGSGYIVLRWVDTDGDFFVRFGVTNAGPSIDPAVSQSGNAYTYSGGTVYVLRTAGVKGSKTNPLTKRDIICSQLDQVVLTYPL